MRKQILFATLAGIAAATLSASPLVYEVTIKGKTTVAKSGKIASECIAGGNSQNATYRKQGNIEIRGLIWFCDCDSFAGPLGFTAPTKDGCYFWDVTNGRPLKNGVIVSPVLHRIENRMKKAEVAMELTADGWHLMLAGFGRAQSFSDGAGRLIDLKGNFAGFRTAPKWTWTEYGVPCTFCDSGTADITYEDTALAWPLCTCAEATPYTAIFGTWMIKYNKVLSDKLNDATAINEIYSFPSYVRKEMGIE